MKAIVQDRYGPDVLQLREVDTPVIGDEEVLVRVHAAGVDQGVWHVMAGLPYLIRLAGYGIRAPKSPVPGADLAGVVEAVGKGVTRFQPGDEVFGIGGGSFAEYAGAREDKLAPRPSNLSLGQAAAVAISSLPALQGLRDHGKVRPGQKVLIIGASGGVGTYAVQLAKALEAEATAVCSEAKVDLVSPSAPTTSSTTGVRTSRRESTTTTSSSTSAGTRPCHACDARSPRKGSLSSPEARRRGAGSGASTGRSGRSCSRPSSARR